MEHHFQAINLHRLVKGALLCDILDNAEVQFGRGRVWVCFPNLLGFCLGADGRDDGVAALEENIQDVRCDEAAATCAEYNR